MPDNPVPELILTSVPRTSPDLRSLTQALDTELYTRYPRHLVNGIDLDAANNDNVFFLVAYLAEEPVGCGAIRPLNAEVTELKRFFVKSDYRGHGIATRILERLETEAKKRGHSALWLETGDRQPESIALYKKAGYSRMPKFGEYRDNPASICFRKSL